MLLFLGLLARVVETEMTQSSPKNLTKITYMTKTKLQCDYENACNAYLENFCARHEFDLDDASWVGKRVGGVADCSEIYVDIETMRVDVDSCCDPDEFFKWYEYSVRAGMLGVVTPNFDSWLRQCPVRTEEELAEMEATRRKIEELEEHLRAMAAGASTQLLPPIKEESFTSIQGSTESERFYEPTIRHFQN